VLSPAEAADHPHNRARGIFAPEGPAQPMPAPRFAEAATPLPPAPPKAGADSRKVLEEAGLDAARIESLFGSGAVA
jgi:alpha-methylacyl-CoA racemase